MTDLVVRLRALAKRLRALADEHKHPLVGWEQGLVATLREAADALEDRTQGALVSKVERQRTEIDALQDKLADAEKRCDLWVERAHKADAEAAALREARFYSTRDGHRARVLCEDGHLKDFPVVGYIEWGDSIVSQCWTSEGKRVIGQDDPEDLLGFSISQPGPGAALLERLRRAEALIKVVFTPGTVTEEHQRVYDEWAALEEKP